MLNPIKIFLGVAAVSLVAAACSTQAGPAADTNNAITTTPAASSTDHSADAAMIMALDSGWIRNFMARNVDSLMTYYAPGAVSYGFAAPGKGPDDIRAIYTEITKSTMSNPTVEPGPVRFSDDGTMAYDHGTFTATMTPPNGKASTGKSAYLNVWKKIDGNWKLLAEMSTPADAGQ